MAGFDEHVGTWLAILSYQKPLQGKNGPTQQTVRDRVSDHISSLPLKLP